MLQMIYPAFLHRNISKDKRYKIIDLSDNSREL